VRQPAARPEGRAAKPMRGPAMPDQETRAQFFEQQAEGWEARNYTPENRDRLRQMLDSLELPSEGTVLDVGCGEGVLIPYLRSIMGPEARIIALDPSAAMLQGAAAKGGGARTIQARAEEIPLENGGADVIICFAAFPHIQGKEAAAAEFHRVLKPGGRAYVLHLGSREEINAHHDGHQAVRGDHLPCPVGMRKIFSEAGFAEAGMVLEDEPGRYFFSARKPGP